MDDRIEEYDTKSRGCTEIGLPEQSKAAKTGLEWPTRPILCWRNSRIEKATRAWYDATAFEAEREKVFIE